METLEQSRLVGVVCGYVVERFLGNKNLSNAFSSASFASNPQSLAKFSLFFSSMLAIDQT